MNVKSIGDGEEERRRKGSPVESGERRIKRKMRDENAWQLRERGGG